MEGIKSSPAELNLQNLAMEAGATFWRGLRLGDGRQEWVHILEARNDNSRDEKEAACAG
jgi:purine nucleoside permease